MHNFWRDDEHIDRMQPPTVNEHFIWLMNDLRPISSNIREVTPADLPTWYDSRLFKHAQKFYCKNMLTGGLSGLLGLIGVLLLPSILQVLIYTKQSGTTCLAFRRYLQTLLHIYTLYRADIEDGNSKWYKSLNVIRMKHAVSSRKHRESGEIGITQKDMALTLYAFVVYPLMSSEKLHMKLSSEDREAFNHFWRVVGHMLGIHDSINICRQNANETEELCRQIHNIVMVHHLISIDKETKYMIDTMLSSFWYLDFTADSDAILALYYRLSRVTYPWKLSWYSWLNMKTRDIQLYICGLPYIGVILRTYYNHFLTFSYWMLEHYPIAAWIGFGRNQATIHLYPKVTNTEE